ncbi:CBS domain-containing protein [Nanoarchaeota archaeon]
MKLFSSSDTARFAKHWDNFHKKTVDNYMTTDVMKISPDDKLIDAANIMIGHNISSLAVVKTDDQILKGIITERDFLKKAPHDWGKLQKMKVSDIMTKSPITAQPSLALMDANDIMRKHLFRKIIISTEGKVDGILTQTDLVRALDDFYKDFRFSTSDSLTVKSIKKPCLLVDSNDTVAVVQKKMVKNNTGTVFVQDKKELVGMFTEYDFLSQLALQPEEMKKQKLGDVMSFPVVAIDAEVDLFDANHLMIEKNFRRLPVLEEGKITGKITQTIIRATGYDILRQCQHRIEKKELEKVNFQKLKKSRDMIREIHGKIQEFRYAE